MCPLKNSTRYGISGNYECLATESGMEASESKGNAGFTKELVREKVNYENKGCCISVKICQFKDTKA